MCSRSFFCKILSLLYSNQGFKSKRVMMARIWYLDKLVLQPRSLYIWSGERDHEIKFIWKKNLTSEHVQISNYRMSVSKRTLAFEQSCFGKTVCRTASVTNLLTIYYYFKISDLLKIHSWFMVGWQFLLHFNSCSMSPKRWSSQRENKVRRMLSHC